MSSLNEFYVGYQPAASPGIRRWLWRVVLVLATACVLLALLLASGQSPFAQSAFEFGIAREYDGEVLEWPYPMLVTEQDHFLLVGPGKFGVADLVRGRAGSRVHLSGTLIARGEDKMLQLDPDSLRFETSAAAAVPGKRDLGAVTLTGEIVDTKCHLGVMNPGNGKVHRDCAVRCISGGAPPGFIVRDAEGGTRMLLLTGSDGRALSREILSFVAEPVTIPGHLYVQGTTWILQAEPRDFRRE